MFPMQRYPNPRGCVAWVKQGKAVTQDDVDALTAKARQALLELAGRFHDFGDTAQAMAEEHRPDLGFGQLARLAFGLGAYELLPDHIRPNAGDICVDAEAAIDAVEQCRESWEALESEEA